MPCRCSIVERRRAVHRIFSAVWRGEKRGKACATSSNCGRIGTRAEKGKRGRGRMCLCPSYTARATLHWEHPVEHMHAILLGRAVLGMLCSALLSGSGLTCCAVPLNQLFAAPLVTSLRSDVAFILRQLQNRRTSEHCERHWCSRNEGLRELSPTPYG